MHIYAGACRITIAYILLGGKTILQPSTGTPAAAPGLVEYFESDTKRAYPTKDRSMWRTI